MYLATHTNIHFTLKYDYMKHQESINELTRDLILATNLQHYILEPSISTYLVVICYRF